MPEVSVIIPFYTGVDWLSEAVDSVLLQTFKDYEIIVVNDGSPENMTEFLNQYSNKIKYIKKENGGPSTIFTPVDNGTRCVVIQSPPSLAPSSTIFGPL